jgi:hypothetical protein
MSISGELLIKGVWYCILLHKTVSGAALVEVGAIQRSSLWAQSPSYLHPLSLLELHCLPLSFWPRALAPFKSIVQPSWAKGRPTVLCWKVNYRLLSLRAPIQCLALMPRRLSPDTLVLGYRLVNCHS